jgi:urease accessory protein
MRRSARVLPDGTWPNETQVGTVTLAYVDRHRRRIVLADDAGLDFLLDLPDAVSLAHGDGLALDSGGVIKVMAANEDVADIACQDPSHLARVAWHLGNRHLPMEVLDELRLRIAWDHVIAAMAEGLGAKAVRARAPFHPEGGAYGQAGHGAGIVHGHAH